MYISTFVFVAVTAMVSFAVATPPSCLLAAVMEQPNPADLKALCGELEPQMASNITASCSGSNLPPAVAAYSSTCLAQGVTISIATTTTGSSSATGTSAPATGTTATTASGNGAGSSSTSIAATTSATGKSAASSVSTQTSGTLLSILLSCGFVGQYLL